MDPARHGEVSVAVEQVPLEPELGIWRFDWKVMLLGGRTRGSWFEPVVPEVSRKRVVEGTGTPLVQMR